MLVRLRFRHGNATIGESDSGYVPDDGWLLHIESATTVGRDVRWRVVGKPMGVFTGVGLQTADRLRPGPVIVQVVPAQLTHEEERNIPAELRSQ